MCFAKPQTLTWERYLLKRKRVGTAWIRKLGAGVAAAAAFACYSCCSTPDFSLPDFRWRLDFSGSLAFDFEFDIDMEFEFDGDFSGWARLDVVTSGSLGIDISGKTAFEQDIDIDIDGDGAEERVSIIGFSDGDPDDVDTILAAWEGDESTFDEGYCYVLVVTEDTVTLIGGECNSDEAVLTCTSPADDLEDVSCEVCDENACERCYSSKVSECIDEGSDALDQIEPEPDDDAESDDDAEPATEDAGEAPTELDAAVPSTDSGASSEAGTPRSDGGAPEAPEAGEVEAPEPDITESAEYQSCRQQVSTLEASVALCGLSLTVDADTLCRTSLSEVEDCFSSIDGLSFLDNPCNVLESSDCSEIVE